MPLHTSNSSHEVMSLIPCLRRAAQWSCTAVTVALLSTGCNGTTTSSAPDVGTIHSAEKETGPATENESSSSNPCTLVSAADLSNILGTAVTQQEGPTEEFRGKSCKYTFPDGGVVGEGHLAITTWHGRAFFSPGTLALDKVSGIGDEAASKDGVSMVRKGEEVLQVHVLSPTKKKTSLQIARAAVTHLKDSP
ncbi:DUF3558 family protein [Streptomyces sp. NPDC057909]|uniref:DUF3558 family protein n=1 Tax=Streptomyces sp. NPDC057909 TaxID=3346277 RepID=UPI0036E51776